MTWLDVAGRVALVGWFAAFALMTVLMMQASANTTGDCYPVPPAGCSTTSTDSTGGSDGNSDTSDGSATTSTGSSVRTGQTDGGTNDGSTGDLPQTGGDADVLLAAGLGLAAVGAGGLVGVRALQRIKARRKRDDA